ncbi:energy-coupling factor transporter transmembrane component T [Companilactobacillus tucceti]|nr:energy-coupling factor transporter transmembrane component T [Companilactobacillus tucceti]
MNKLFFNFRRSTNNLSILFYLLSIILSALLFNDPVVILMIFVALVLMVLYSKKDNSRGYFKFFTIIFVTTIIFNLLINQRGAGIIFQIPFLKVTTESLLNAAILAFSFVNLLMAFYIYDSLTNVKVIFDLLSHKLRNIAIVFILTVKFIPKIIDIFESTSFLIKFRSNHTINNKLQRQLDLLETVLNKSVASFMNMSDILVTKGYGNDRIKQKISNTKIDYILLATSITSMIFNIIMVIQKIGKVDFGSMDVKIAFGNNIILGSVNFILIIIPILIGVFQYICWKWYVSKITASNTPTVKNFR